MKKAIIIGATSGIGKSLAELLASNGYQVGIAGRRVELLEEMRLRLPNQPLICQIDVADTENAIASFKGLAEEMGEVDLVVISSGVDYVSRDLPWEKDKMIIQINVMGFTAIANTAFNYFLEQGRGHLVGISSVTAVRGGLVTAYNASKAYVSNYLEGLQFRAYKSKKPITVTDIKPGYVDTPMAEGKHLFWAASPEKTAQQILGVIDKKKDHAYVTKRWRLVAWVVKMMPRKLYYKS